jgi:hypothetical protein
VHYGKNPRKKSFAENKKGGKKFHGLFSSSKYFPWAFLLVNSVIEEIAELKGYSVG